VPRLFVAVWPPEPVLDVVAGLARPEVPGLRWTGRDQWHVTLRFMGPVDEVAPVVDALAGVRDGLPVEAVVGPAVGRFGHRVLHVPVGGLDGLAAWVVEATAGLGRPPDDREFAGHLTLARVSKGARVDLARLAGEPVSGRWAVEDVCLVESRPGPGGSRYEVLERFPLSPSVPPG
jgi:RNA 2',3'-cyclic 3'-phosphodiesterase